MVHRKNKCRKHYNETIYSNKSCCVDGCDGGKRYIKGADGLTRCERHHVQIKKHGRITDYIPTVYGVGINDVKGVMSKNNKLNNRIYYLWKSMLRRCYCEDFLILCPSYRGCSVCERWHRLSNFMNDIRHIDGYDLWVNSDDNRYCLDKDIKIKGNKEYSINTCKFVTIQENSKDATTRVDYKEKSKNTDYIAISSKRMTPVVGISVIDGSELKFKSMQEANKHGFHHSAISRCCSGKLKQYKGYTWRKQK